MLAAYATLRALGLLRRVARSLEAIADSVATIERCEATRLLNESRRTKRGSVTEISTLDQSAANAVWKARRAAAGLEDDGDE